MQVIISHMNTDFDALASILAAKKLYPEATIVLSDKHNAQVKRFLNIYRDTLDYVSDRDLAWEEVTELIIVDVASLRRASNFANKLNEEKLKYIVYDHHPPAKNDIEADEGVIDEVGAAVTILIEKIQEKSLPISEFEATIFGLGIYTDTGNFTYNTTTTRDFDAARYLMECGMNLEMIQRFATDTLDPNQQSLLDELFVEAESFEIDGLEIVLAIHEQDEFQGGLAVLTQKILEMKSADAMLSIVKMKHHVYVVGRASAERVNLQPLLKMLGGGGHQHAGSATIKRGDFAEVQAMVKENLTLILQPAVTAKQIMATPVKKLSPDTTIEEAGKRMYRYGHSGYPIVENDKLVGIITRRDLDKANHHGLGHAPVKAYMTTNIIVINPETTLEEIQKIVIEHNVGRLPVIENGNVVGIVTRTNIIEKIHEQLAPYDDNGSITELKDNIEEEMAAQLPEHIYEILQEISELATENNTNVYLIGGIVRDILLEQPNDDVDIVVEGNGIAFAKKLHEAYGGKLTTHEQFGTATWKHPSSLEIDIATSRLEYYARPASLPDVEDSTLQQDLYRRDFTINAMGIYLNEEHFGQLVDPFAGQVDLYNETIKVLHNLSFVEDPTRILRAIRFETRFRFKMDEQTENLALNSMEQMKDVSAKRIIDEVKRMFEEEDVVRAMERLYEVNFWQQYMKEQEGTNKQALLHADKLQALYENMASKLSLRKDWFIFYCVPFYTADQTQAVEAFILTRDNRKLYEELRHAKALSLDEYEKVGDLHRVLKPFSTESVLFTIASRPLINETIVLDYLLKRQDLVTYMTGQDLKALDLRPGPQFKSILLELEVAVLNGEVDSQASAKEWVNDYIASL